MMEENPSPRLFLASLLLLLLLLLPLSTDAANITTDALSLLAFKANLTIHDSKLDSWLSDNISTVCSTWWGVACSSANASASDARIVNLTLGGRSLTGTIPSNTIGSIDSLQILSLRDNFLSGQLPPDLANCRNLTKIRVYNNRFSGELTPIADLPLLDTILLNNNSFSGAIPLFSSLPKVLRTLNVSYNQLDGSIPASVTEVFSDASVFAGNPGLCGAPLNVQCSSASAPASTPAPSGNPPPSAPSGDSRSGDLTKGEIAGIVLGSILGFILLLSCFYVTATLIGGKRGRHRRKSGVVRQHRYGGGGAPSGSAVSPYPPPFSSPPDGIGSPAATSWDRRNSKHELVFVPKGGTENQFTMEDLLRASAEVMGKGSFGITYKAKLEDGRHMVVKRLKDLAGEAEEIGDIIERRLAPLASVADASHYNLLLLPIVAYFFVPKSDQNLILLPYMYGGSLASRLHHQGNGGNGNVALSWEERLNVAIKVAQAIAYLHKNNVVHGNVKSSNVLFDADGEVRLADYGLLSIAVYSAQINIKVLQSYLPPEVIIDPHRAQSCADVYSYGILLLELLTGKSPSDVSIQFDDPNNNDNVDSLFYSTHGEAPLTHWVNSTIKKQKSVIFDTRIETFENIVNEMEHVLEIALTCVAVSPEARPPMDKIVTQICNIHPTSNSS